MKSKKGDGWFWVIIALIIIIISIVLIVGFYIGIFPKFSEAVRVQFLGPIK